MQISIRTVNFFLAKTSLLLEATDCHNPSDASEKSWTADAFGIEPSQINSWDVEVTCNPKRDYFHISFMHKFSKDSDTIKVFKFSI